MDILDIHKRTDVPPAAGKILIAEPFLTDPGFARTVVLLCEHGPEGSIGFVLNRPFAGSLSDLLPDLQHPGLEVSEGGPVAHGSLHVIHSLPALMGGAEILPGVYWGSSYNDLSRAVADNSVAPEQLRLFVGYAGWGGGQLEQELQDGAWLVADCPADLIFRTATARVWQDSIRSLGAGFAYMAHLPLHPQLN